ncbi:UNVERIFIED_CONTAM: hypothetical protein Sradi_3017500 [Sesamum radiatum]|uniref:Uncharacterized protein n=1 Tax=Sesamum radiatum TaxID=300843 RepID=A0AAW2S1J5_SESRA
MVTTMMHQHQNHGNPPPSSAAIGSIRSPPSHSQSHSHRLPSPSPLSLDAPSRIRLSDILPYDGAPMGPYIRAVDALSNSLMRHNAAVIELGPEDAALLRCALESARLYFRTRKGGRGVYTYRAGRPLEDVDASPPCMADIFRCMGRAARAALSAIARHLRLRSDVFSHLLDDNPLPANEASSSVLVATYSQITSQQGKGATGGGKLGLSCEAEKGLLMLVSSDAPGLQVCDPNGRWYQADSSLAPGDLLLLTGKALGHATAGLRPAASYRATPDNLLNPATGGRTSLAFRLMPQGNAVLDCTPIAAAGHVIPPSYVPISVSQFMDDLSAEEDVLCNHTDNAYVPADNLNSEPSLRSVLSDPLSYLLKIIESGENVRLQYRSLRKIPTPMIWRTANGLNFNSNLDPISDFCTSLCSHTHITTNTTTHATISPEQKTVFSLVCILRSSRSRPDPYPFPVIHLMAGHEACPAPRFQVDGAAISRSPTPFSGVADPLFWLRLFALGISSATSASCSTTSSGGVSPSSGPPPNRPSHTD